MVGGRINQKGDNNERIFRGEFPEKPGALLSFLEKFGSDWNISLFHYRNLGSAFGKILIGIEDVNSNKHRLTKHLKQVRNFVYRRNFKQSLQRLFKITNTLI